MGEINQHIISPNIFTILSFQNAIKIKIICEVFFLSPRYQCEFHTYRISQFRLPIIQCSVDTCGQWLPYQIVQLQTLAAFIHSIYILPVEFIQAFFSRNQTLTQSRLLINVCCFGDLKNHANYFNYLFLKSCNFLNYFEGYKMI